MLVLTPGGMSVCDLHVSTTTLGGCGSGVVSRPVLVYSYQIHDASSPIVERLTRMGSEPPTLGLYQVDEEMGNQLMGTMLYLDSIDGKKDIYLYINSMGGDVVPTLAIQDTMQVCAQPRGVDSEWTSGSLAWPGCESVRVERERAWGSNATNQSKQPAL